MDKNKDGTWWVEYLDTTKEHPEYIREQFDTESDAISFYNTLDK